MQLLKPLWLAHVDEGRQCEIYSVSISPDGKRLASGGQDSKVRIWSVDAIMTAAPDHVPSTEAKASARSSDLVEDDSRIEGALSKSPAKSSPPQTITRQLCSMSNHNGAVTVVRFCPRGQYLASGSDDKVVLIWELDKSRAPRQEFGFVGEKDSEVWTARKRLTGHESDVQDLAWSPNGSLLVTVGLDSSVIVWSGTTFEMLKRIDIHDSHVKGVAFDPANKYFITCSDDRTAQIVRYIRTSNELTFSVESIISQPFVNSPLNTFFRRCSWAPNGETIACPNAVNGPVSTVGIVNRGDWDSETSLCGHEGPCEVVCFNPRVFATDKLAASSPDPVGATACVLATGGQDSTLVLWNTSSPRPLTVVKNVARRPISDIAWSPDGLRVFASSLDGSVFALEFAPGNLGWPLSTEIVVEHLKRYGTSSQDMNILESAEQLSIEFKYSDKDKAHSRLDANTSALKSAKPDTPVKVAGAAPQSLPLNETAESLASTSGEIASKNKDHCTASRSPPDEPQTENKAASPVFAGVAGSTSTTARSRMKQKVTITKNGKKRIAPTLIQEDSAPTNIAAARDAATHTMPENHRQANSTIRASTGQTSSLEFSRPSNALPVGGVQSLLAGNKRRTLDGEMATPQGTGKKLKEGNQQFIRPAALNPSTTVSQVRLATQKVYTHLSLDRSASAVLEIRNGEQPTDPARVTVVQDGANLFIDYIPGKAHLLTGDVDFFWAISTENGTLHVYTPTGSHAFPPLVLGAALAVLESKENILLSITNTGLLHMWDIGAKKAIFSPVSIAPILDSGSKYEENGLLRAPTISNCVLGDPGHFLITLSNGTAHTYDPDMKAWHRVSEPSWSYGSQFWDSTGFASLFEGSRRTGGLVSLAERSTNEVAFLKAGARGKQLQRIARNRVLQDGYQGYEEVVSLAHLQNRVLAAAMLHSQLELEKHLEVYVRRAAEEALLDKLHEIFIFLFNDGLDGEWAGLSKHDLLQKMLEEAAKHRGAQSLVIQYDEALRGVVDVTSDKSMMQLGQL